MGPLHIHKANTHLYPKENHEMTINQNPDISDWDAEVNLFISVINCVFHRIVPLQGERDPFFPLNKNIDWNVS